MLAFPGCWLVQMMLQAQPAVLGGALAAVRLTALTGLTMRRLRCQKHTSAGLLVQPLQAVAAIG